MGCQNYVDPSGRSWEFRFTIGLFRKIHRDLGYDLLDWTDGWLARLDVEDRPFIELVLFILREQLESRQVSDDQFCDQLDADEFTKLRESFQSALDFFFRKNKTKTVAIQRMRTEFERQIQESFATPNGHGETSGPPQDISESTPTTIPSAN